MNSGVRTLRQWASHSLHLTLWIVSGIGISACAVGPNFRSPDPPTITRYTVNPLPHQTSEATIHGGEAQRFVDGQDIPAQWWTLFHSSAVDSLVSQALKINPTVQGAQAALRQAMENVSAQRGAYYPTLQANYAMSRQQNPVGTLSPTLNSGEPIFNLHTTQVSVGYLFDIFGLNRRQVESLQALADAQRFQVEATYLTLITNVVTTAIQEASLREQIAATQEIVRSEAEATAIFHRQYDIGAVSMSDVMLQESALAAAEATLPPLEKQLVQQKDSLAVLLGRFPSEAVEEEFELSTFELPKELPLTIPSRLVRQRPDVLAAEAQLHAAAAQVGVAIANMLPQISLSAGAGSVATQSSGLFKSGNGFWNAGASLTQTLFAGGSLYHRKRAADAALDQAGAQYRSVVLAAFQNVADTLQALESDADALKTQVHAETVARESLDIARRNLALGSVNNLVLVSAQQSYQQAIIGLAQAKANRYADTVALFQALGGGWWNR